MWARNVDFQGPWEALELYIAAIFFFFLWIVSLLVIIFTVCVQFLPQNYRNSSVDKKCLNMCILTDVEL